MYEIKLGLGLENIRFGISRAELKELIGEPSNVEFDSLVDEEDGEKTETEYWEYGQEGLIFEFSSDDGDRINAIEISNINCLINNARLIGKHRDEVLNVLNSFNIGDYDAVYEGFYDYIHAGLMIEFSDDDSCLESIKITPIWDLENDCYLWPTQEKEVEVSARILNIPERIEEKTSWKFWNGKNIKH